MILRWDREKNAWFDRRGLLGGRHWSDVIDEVEQGIRREFQRHFNHCREEFLDTCHGECPLANRQVAGIVGDALQHLDGARYQLGDFVVMPNHVHLLAAFPSSEGMKKQLTSWLYFTAVQINRFNQRTGHLWQPEPFDHPVRSTQQYDYLRRYIADNPRKANLDPGRYLHYRRP